MAFGIGKAAVKSISHVIGSDKPHSSISDWVDILSSARYNEDDYEGIPELVESITLQPSGPTEACRAIRKKLKYGDVHRQLRSVTILKALVENSGQKFQAVFQHDPLLERIKFAATDSMTDERVRKMLMSALASWQRQYKDDTGMAIVAGLYQVCGGGRKTPAPRPVEFAKKASERETWEKGQEDAGRRLKTDRKNEEAAKRKAKAASAQPKTKSKPFNFEEEKPNVLLSISTASQAANNLINALKLVNREKESIVTNARVQECLAEAKAARKTVIRYIQLVLDENFIGTLIDSNERVITALQMYDHMLTPADEDSDEDPSIAAKMQTMQTTGNSTNSEPELLKLQDKQRLAIERARERQGSVGTLNPYGFPRVGGAETHVHPDLEDLTFNTSTSRLPPPIQPNADHEPDHHATLSDFSDYESSDEGTHAPRPSISNAASFGNHAYAQVAPAQYQQTDDRLVDFDDPFADPTAENSEVGTPGIAPRKQYVY